MGQVVFNNLGWGEMAFLVVLALFIFGPDRLPKVAADAARTLKQLRGMARNATADIRSELGPEFADLDLADLNPRRFVERHLLSEDDEDEAEEVRPEPETRPQAGGPPLEANELPPFDREAT